MSTGLINIGVTGMSAAQYGLLTSEHNIANATTPGFSRQRTTQATNQPLSTGAGFLGQGTHVATVERLYSQLLTTQVNRAQTSVSELDTYYNEVKQIDNMLADATAGVSPALQDFFKGVQQVAANPAQLPARQSMVSAAQALASRFQNLEDRLSQIADGVNEQITATVSTINSYVEQVADMNQQIVLAQAASNQPANDLLDQRDLVVADLNKLVRVTTTTNDDGSYNLFIGSGQQLVVGTQFNTLVAKAADADASRTVVALQTSGAAQELPESLITGGSLGGLVQFRSQSLDRVANELGRNAASQALTFNAQHKLGQDLLGNITGDAAFEDDFFTVSGPRVTANSRNTGSADVSASFVDPPPTAGNYTLALNAGTYTLTRLSDGTQWSDATLDGLQAGLPSNEGVSVANIPLGAGVAESSGFYTNLTYSDYRLDYDGANYTLTRLTDNAQWTNASLTNLSTTIAASEGFQFSATAAPAAGDSFLIRPAAEAARNFSINKVIAADPRLIAAAMPVRTGAATTNTGTAQISAGSTVFGFDGSIPDSNGLTLTYDADTVPPSFSIAGTLPAGTNVSVSAGGTTIVYPATAAIEYTSGATISLAGISFTISGTPSDNDKFTLKQNTSGVADGRNVLALGKLQTQNTMSGAKATFQSAYAQMVSDNGNKTRELQVTGAAQQSLLEQAESSRDSLSGVNLDEEAANLIRFQQAYQASAKMIEIGSKLFDILVSIGS